MNPDWQGLSSPIWQNDSFLGPGGFFFFSSLWSNENRTLIRKKWSRINIWLAFAKRFSSSFISPLSPRFSIYVFVRGGLTKKHVMTWRPNGLTFVGVNGLIYSCFPWMTQLTGICSQKQAHRSFFTYHIPSLILSVFPLGRGWQLIKEEGVRVRTAPWRKVEVAIKEISVWQSFYLWWTRQGGAMAVKSAVPWKSPFGEVPLFGHRSVGDGQRSILMQKEWEDTQPWCWNPLRKTIV